MREAKAQCAIASHGDSADRASRAAGANPVFTFDVGQELLQKKIVVAHGSVRRIDVKAAAAFGCGDEKIAHLVLLAQILEQRPAATVEEGLLVIAQTVQEIEHRIALWRILLRGGIVVCRYVDAIMHDLLKDMAVQCTAVDAALSGRKGRHNQKEQEDKPEGADHAGLITR